MLYLPTSARLPVEALLDEFEHMDARIKRLGELINVRRGNNCQAILSKHPMRPPSWCYSLGDL